MTHDEQNMRRRRADLVEAVSEAEAEGAPHLGDLRARLTNLDDELRELEQRPSTDPPIVGHEALVRIKAQEIIDAGRRTRGHIEDRPPIPKGLAGEIVRAAAKARGEIDDPPSPLTGLAREIIEAGARARGEVPEDGGR